ncbi:hypothetical protein HGRIS_003076 [Hohenbuehelia grisea]|uniref:F-box domain-containing protein n=1 Tax=Hohenbuehelia grisea TaxID=104357 RepID=A0ABR3JMC4_9AGAR
MPPKKRQKYNKESSRDSPPPDEQRSHSSIQAARTSNSASAFLKLPIEVMLEIISYYPLAGMTLVPVEYRHNYSAPLEWQRPSYSVLPGVFLDRYEALRALTLTCSALRRSILPVLWEHVEACSASHAETGWYKSVGVRLRCKSNILFHNPHLAEHVQTITVAFTRYQTESVLGAFARCLTCLPNLHTVNIFHAHSQMTTAIQKAFEGFTFPTVTTICLPTSAHQFLRCCPNIRQVDCAGGDGSQLISAISKACKHVEQYECVETREETLIKRLGKAAPELRTLGLQVAALIYIPDITKVASFSLWIRRLTFSTSCRQFLQTCLRAAANLRLYTCISRCIMIPIPPTIWLTAVLLPRNRFSKQITAPTRLAQLSFTVITDLTQALSLKKFLYRRMYS